MNELNTTSQDSIIFNYLKEGNTITTAEAFSRFKIVDLQSVIRNLRKVYTIQDKWISQPNLQGKMVRFKRYWLDQTTQGVA